MSDILADLRKYADLSIGDPVPPEMLDMADIARRAIAEIEHLRSLAGAVSKGGGSFRDIARDVPRSDPSKHRVTTGC